MSLYDGSVGVGLSGAPLVVYCREMVSLWKLLNAPAAPSSIRPLAFSPPIPSPDTYSPHTPPMPLSPYSSPLLTHPHSFLSPHPSPPPPLSSSLLTLQEGIALQPQIDRFLSPQDIISLSDTAGILAAVSSLAIHSVSFRSFFSSFTFFIHNHFFSFFVFASFCFSM